jgi:hypothetical protein
MFKKKEEKVDVISSLGNWEGVEIEKIGNPELYSDMAKIDGLHEFFRETMINDIKRYFAAQTDRERDIIRGAFSRTNYLKNLLDNVDN